MAKSPAATEPAPHDPAERAELIALAARIEHEACDQSNADEVVAPLLDEFNRRLVTETTRETFRRLYQSQEVEELVDSLLTRRAALPTVTAPVAVTAATLPAFLAARSAETYMHDAGWDEAQRDLDALAPLTCLPREVISSLLAAELPADPRAQFMLEYRPPTCVDDLRVTARAYARALAGEVSPRGAVALDLLEAELSQVPDAELALLFQFGERGDPRLRAYVKKLALLG